jgi:bifunctional UDP-N-acetylglucosamine pyrophosphorylase/glucosamine-1-phosphate N-acetyltransferase
MEPLGCGRQLHEICIAGTAIAVHLENLFKHAEYAAPAELEIKADFRPSPALVKEIIGSSENLVVLAADGSELLKFTCSGSGNCRKIEADKDSMQLRFPWDILAVNEKLVAEISENKIHGDVSDRATIAGVLHAGKGTVILPGVYIEGKVIIGENCKIGPNCYLRGNTYIGNNCHIGQAVEIKNSLIMDKVSIGHLSYIGDSVICRNTNIGAGAITANLRHDGKNHRSMVDNCLVDTGRRKFGVIIGEDVHTGIHNSIYPGRKIWPGASTEPGAIIKYDLKV